MSKVVQHRDSWYFVNAIDACFRYNALGFLIHVFLSNGAVEKGTRRLQINSMLLEPFVKGGGGYSVLSLKVFVNTTPCKKEYCMKMG